MTINPIFVAVDTDDLAHALNLATMLRPHIGGLKLGLEFFTAHGPAGIRAMAELGLPLFIDLKLHDIPNTVAGAVRSLGPLKPAVLTVHASGGATMLAAAKAAAPAGTKVVAVTVLTSLDADDLGSIGVAASPAAQVARLASLARSSGLDGIVCSPHEVAAAIAAWPGCYVVAPGLRPAGDDVGDQKRVMTPAGALAAGASMLVIGRPITDAADPVATAAAIAATL